MKLALYFTAPLVVALLSAAPAYHANAAGECDGGTSYQVSGTSGDATIVGNVVLEGCDDDAPDSDEVSSAPGGGDGGALDCSYEPMGPIEEVLRVIEAVNAEQQPVVATPNFIVDVVMGAGATRPRVVRTAWYRVEGTAVQVLHKVTCPGQLSDTQWLTMSAAGGTLVPQVRAIDLVPALQARVTRQLPTPVARIGPADTNPNGWTFVQHPTFFWLDQRTGQWETVSATASAGSVSVTVSAEPVRLVVDPGDGSARVTCNGPPPAVTVQNYGTVRGCAHSYRNSSAMAPNGESYPVTTSIVWHASWTANTGESGDLGFLSTTSPTRMLQVAEIQAIVTDGGSG